LAPCSTRTRPARPRVWVIRIFILLALAVLRAIVPGLGWGRSL
jgi:hypothetical protein